MIVPSLFTAGELVIGGRALTFASSLFASCTCRKFSIALDICQPGCLSNCALQGKSYLDFSSTA